MNEELKKLTKEDLIRVIANLSDNILWLDVDGFIKEDVERLNTISAMCMEHCVKTNNWKIPNI
jgi:hypothetical protein